MKDLLLLHGAIGTKDQLEPLADCLNKKYKIHTINFNGHGGIHTGNAFSIEGFGMDVMQYLEKNHITETAIFGYSMGGYVALQLAKNHHRVISKVVTLATKFHWDEASATKEIKMLDANTIAEKLPLFAKQLQDRHGARNWEAVLENTRNLMLQLGRHNALQLADYSDIIAPCLLLLGEKDKMVTIEETISVQRALPIAIYRNLANTSHPMEQVDVKMLAAIIEEFVQ